MKLTLFREPLRETFKPDLIRLLFEGKEGESAGQKDFYLYVWISAGTRLDGFQAVLEDSITLVYRQPDYVTVGRIGRVPMNRAVDNNDSDEDREAALTVIRTMESGDMPVLIGEIKRIASGEAVSKVYLVKEERELFMNLHREDAV